MDQYNLKYIPMDVTKDKNLFVEEYYTGVDTDIYINGKKCDYISSIQYTMQEQLNPLYGYASYTYDDIAIGNRIVVGSIRVPITNYSVFTKNFTSENEIICYEKNIPINDKPMWVNSKSNGYANYYSINELKEEYEKNKEIVDTPFWTDMFYEDGKIVSNDELPPVSGDLRAGEEKTAKGKIHLPSSFIKNRIKPKYKSSPTTFFHTQYTNSDNDNLYNMKMIRNNYKDIRINVGNNINKTLKYVTFRSLDHEYDSNGSPLFEIIQFVARDLIEENFDKV